MDKQRVEQILTESEVLLNGHFVLTSGRHSDRYMQCARLMQYPWHTEELANGLASEFKQDGIDAVIGPATGGIIIAYELARQLKVKNMFAERENGSMVLRRSFSIEPGMRLLVAEDVTTTGGTVFEIIDLVKKLGGEPVGVALLVDRSMGNVDFGMKLRAAYTAEIQSWLPEECPLCKAGGQPAIKPGSRSLKA